MGCMPSLSVGVLWNLPAPPSWEPTGGVAGCLEHAETGNCGGRLLKLVGICGGLSVYYRTTGFCGFSR